MVTLIGCVSRKAPGARPARDLYDSELFRRRWAFAERSSRPWLILSALHGVVDPDTILRRLRRLQRGEAIWRIVCRIDADAIIVVDVFSKKAAATPKAVIDA